MTCKRYVYEYLGGVNYRTIPPTFSNKPVRYRDEHAAECDGTCTPVELPWPRGEPWEQAPRTPDFDAMAREIALNTSWNFPDHGGLTIVHGVLAHLISSALSKAYEEGRLHERKIAIGDPIDLREAFGAIDE